MTRNVDAIVVFETTRKMWEYATQTTYSIIIEESHHILSDERRSLVGFNRGRIATSYSTGTVSGDKRVGGLMGRKSKKKLLFDVFAILRWRFLREFADSARILLIMR